MEDTMGDGLKDFYENAATASDTLRMRFDAGLTPQRMAGLATRILEIDAAVRKVPGRLQSGYVKNGIASLKAAGLETGYHMGIYDAGEREDVAGQAIRTAVLALAEQGRLTRKTRAGLERVVGCAAIYAAAVQKLDRQWAKADFTK
jgi:hypothetical protein